MKPRLPWTTVSPTEWLDHRTALNKAHCGISDVAPEPEKEPRTKEFPRLKKDWNYEKREVGEI